MNTIPVLLGVIAAAGVALVALGMRASKATDATSLLRERLIRQELGVNMSVGAGNVGFGLPDRPPLTATFILLGMQAGLTAAITNALDPEIYRLILAGDLMLGRDPFGKRWNTHFRRRTARPEPRPQAPIPATPAPGS